MAEAAARKGLHPLLLNADYAKPKRARISESARVFFRPRQAKTGRGRPPKKKPPCPRAACAHKFRRKNPGRIAKRPARTCAPLYANCTSLQTKSARSIRLRNFMREPREPPANRKKGRASKYALPTVNQNCPRQKARLLHTFNAACEAAQDRLQALQTVPHTPTVRERQSLCQALLSSQETSRPSRSSPANTSTTPHRSKQH